MVPGQAQQNQVNMAGSSQAQKGQNLNQSYYSQMSSVTGGNGNAAQASSMGLGSINIAFPAGPGQGPPPGGRSGGDSQLSMSNLSSKYNGQSAGGFQNPPLA